MPVLSLDPEVIEFAQLQLQGMAGQIGQEAARHSRVAQQVHQALVEMAHALLDTLNSLSQFDPWGPWNNWGLGQLRAECQTSHDIISGVRTSARDIVRQLREQQGDVVGAALAARAYACDDALGSALQILWGVLEGFDPSNLISFLYDPSALPDNIEWAGRVLRDATNLVNDYIAYLERVRQREESVIGSIVSGVVSSVSAVSHTLGAVWNQYEQRIAADAQHVGDAVTMLEPVVERLAKMITHDTAEELSTAEEDLKSIAKEIEDVAGQLREMKELPPEVASVLKGLARDAEELRGTAEEIGKVAENLKEVPIIGKVANVLTVVVDIVQLAAGKKDPRTVITELGADAIGFEPHVAIAQAVALALSLPGEAMSWDMQREANQTSGPYKQEFNQLANEWRQNAHGFRVVNDSLPQDLFSLWVDTGGLTPGSVPLPGITDYAKIPSDAWHVTKDVGSVLWSAVDFGPLWIASNAAMASVNLRQADQWIQAMPAPSWVKGDLNWATNTGSQCLNDVATTIIHVNNFVDHTASTFGNVARDAAHDVAHFVTGLL